MVLKIKTILFLAFFITLVYANDNDTGQVFYEDKRIDNSANGVDPDNYFIGGGDSFLITISGLPSVSFSAIVNQDNNIYIPEFGLIKLGKISLTDAKKSISDFLHTKLKDNNEISVSLYKVKECIVSVTGIMENAGSLRVPGNYRIYDVLKKSNKKNMLSISEYNLRSVEIKNLDSTRYIDLFQYLFKNDQNHNPYIYPGDNIFLRFADSRVFVSGCLKGSLIGLIPIKPGEDLLDFLSLLTFHEKADSNTILFQRQNEKNPIEISFHQASGIQIQNGDAILIRQKSDYPEMVYINIDGEVRRPGWFSVKKNTKMANELIELAGGITEFANLDGGVVIRKNMFIGQNDISNIRPEISSALQKMGKTNDFSVISLRQFDLQIELRNEDVIYIPMKEGLVHISGNVSKPGTYKYDPGNSFRDYIRNAGGFTSKADKSNCFVLHNYKYASQIKDTRRIEDGDIIVVPDSHENKILLTFVVPLITVIANLATVGLAIYNTAR